MTGLALAYPMHGQHKLSNEGYRTRDGHIIDWLGRFAAESSSHIEVVSRPEPVVLAPLLRIRGPVATGTAPLQTRTWRIPSWDRKRWWVRSSGAYPKVDQFGDAPQPPLGRGVLRRISSAVMLAPVASIHVVNTTFDQRRRGWSAQGRP